MENEITKWEIIVQKKPGKYVLGNFRNNFRNSTFMTKIP